MTVKVLVAEDVAVNRELIRLILEPRGYLVDTVDDGERAVVAVRAGDFDVVIMDMQMPIMDGLQATRAIRSWGGRFATLPILGLSANVVPDQVERCLAAGMTAHLGKPFTSEGLAAALSGLEAKSSTLQPKTATLMAPTGGMSASQLQVLLAMLNQQIETFERGDLTSPAALAQQAHSLRGAAAIMSFQALAQACRDLEAACDSGDWRLALTTASRAARAAKRSIRAQIEIGS